MEASRTVRRTPLSVYLAELSIGTVAALGLFLLFLWVLPWVFPDSTELGDLVRLRPDLPAFAPSGPASEPASATVAVLSAVHREVRGKPASSVVWSVASRGSTLGEGDAVQSYADSSATLTFDEHNTLDLGEKSLIVVRKSRRAAGTIPRGTSVLLMDGFLRARLGAAGPAQPGLELLAGGGVVRSRDDVAGPAEIALALDPQGSVLSVETGDVDVVWNDRVTRVPSGHMVTFDPSRAPGTPVTLPEAPLVLAPADGATFPYRAAPPRVSFSWRPVDGTSEFTLEIARDPRFAQRVFERRQPETTFVHGALPAGEYYWRVVGRVGRIEGAASRASRFTIAAVEHPPLLRVEFPGRTVAGRVAVIRGETEADCRVIIGEATVLPDANGRFEHALDLRPGYNFVLVQAVDPVGNTAFESHTIVAESRDSERVP